MDAEQRLFREAALAARSESQIERELVAMVRVPSGFVVGMLVLIPLGGLAAVLWMNG